MTRRLLAVWFFALTACSGRAALPMAAPVPLAPARVSDATVDLKIAVAMHVRAERGPRYVPRSMKSAKIALKGKTLAIVNLTAGSKECKGTPVTCSASFKAPAGKDVFTVTLYDRTNAKGKALSQGSVAAKIVGGKANRITVVCGGVVASLRLDLAQTAPPPTGSAQTIALTLSGLDADGNTIVGPGSYRNGPIEIADSDTSHTQLKAGSGAASSSVNVVAPGIGLGVLYDGSASLTAATFTASMPKVPSVAPASVKMTPAGAVMTVDAAHGSPAISKDVLGVNLPVWIDNTQPFIATAYKTAGVKLVRWPGGSLADTYHWAGPSACNGEYFDPNSTFDNFMNDVAVPDDLDVAITVNYGSNGACTTGGGDPSEAYAWALHAHTMNWNVPYWTVGNEVFGSWEFDQHASPHDPSTYVSAMNGSTGYYQQIKNGYPPAQVGIVVSGGTYSTWDSTVIAQSSYDFVEFHYYAQAGAASGQSENDTYLLTTGVDNLVSDLKAVRTQVNTYNSYFKPIFLGELNSVVTTPGKQTVSITNGLFLGMAMAEVMKLSGVSLASWWLGSGDCHGTGDGGNFSSTLYGFQDYGAYTLFSDGPGGSCPSALPAAGTPFPDGRAFAMLARFAGSGSIVRTVTTSTPASKARFYADTLASGYGLLLFNLSKTSPLVTSVVLKNSTHTSFAATQETYGKTQYDKSQSGTWSGPVTSSLGTVGTSFTVTLPPWSMNLVTLSP